MNDYNVFKLLMYKFSKFDSQWNLQHFGNETHK
jgi:hypothetical protein